MRNRHVDTIIYTTAANSPDKIRLGLGTINKCESWSFWKSNLYLKRSDRKLSCLTCRSVFSRIFVVRKWQVSNIPQFEEDTNSSSSGDPSPLCRWRWMERCTDKQTAGIRPDMLSPRSLRISISLSPPYYRWFTPSHALTRTQRTRALAPPTPANLLTWNRGRHFADTLDGGHHAADLSPRPVLCKEPGLHCPMLRERTPTKSEDDKPAIYRTKTSGFSILS